MKRFFSPKTFFFLNLFFIFYATTIPWDIAHAPNLERVSWTPGWDAERDRIWSIPDLVQNVVLFMPYGFFAFLGLGFVRRRGALLGPILAGFLGLALSSLVEILQTMGETRSPSTTDLATNFAGALFGGAVAGIYVRLLEERIKASLRRTVRERPGILVLGAYFTAIVLGSLAPFIPTLDIGMLRHQVRLFLDAPFGEKPLGALVTDGLLFAALAYLVAAELPSYLGSKRWWPLFKRPPPQGQRPRSEPKTSEGLAGEFTSPLTSPVSRAVAVAVAVVLTSGLAIALEGAQLFIIGHSPGVQDALVGVYFSIVGGGAAFLRGRSLGPASRLGEASREAPWLVFSFALLAPFCRALQPFEFRPFAEAWDAIDTWQFVPFWALFQNINVSTFRNVFEAAAIYLPLGYAIAAIGRTPKIGFFACLVFAEILEVLQILVRGRVFDVTDGVYAALMGLFGSWLLGELERAPAKARSDTAPMVHRPLVAVAERE